MQQCQNNFVEIAVAKPKLVAIISFSLLMLFLAVYFIISDGMDGIHQVALRKGAAAYFYVPFFLASSFFMAIFWMVPAFSMLFEKYVCLIYEDSIMLPGGVKIRYSQIDNVKTVQFPRKEIHIYCGNLMHRIASFASAGSEVEIFDSISCRIEHRNS
ncbi:hypothetical protein [Sphingomonas sp.]